MIFNNLTAGGRVPDEFNAIIEIPAQSYPVKYEAEKALGFLKVDRILGNGMRYPENYGFIPGTLSEDGDPLDVLVLCPYPLASLSLIECRPVALLNMTDEAGPDAKIVAVPTDTVCKATAHYKNLEDLPVGILKELQFFFEHYKKGAPGKWVKFEGWQSRGHACEELSKSVEAYKKEHRMCGNGGCVL